jgi:hypothetical protein
LQTPDHALQLVWQEGRRQPDGYGTAASAISPAMVKTHFGAAPGASGGEKMFVDYAGAPFHSQP